MAILSAERLQPLLLLMLTIMRIIAMLMMMCSDAATMHAQLSAGHVRRQPVPERRSKEATQRQVETRVRGTVNALRNADRLISCAAAF